jgi:hypothetical protein
MKKAFVLTCATFALAAPTAAIAAPTTGPEAGPGCFGQWRAGSVQAIDQAGGNAGQIFASRAGDNSTINADNRATCAAL